MTGPVTSTTGPSYSDRDARMRTVTLLEAACRLVCAIDAPLPDDITDQCLDLIDQTNNLADKIRRLS